MDKEDLHKSARLHIKGLQLNVELFVGGKCWKRSRLYVKPEFTGEGLICKFFSDIWERDIHTKSQKSGLISVVSSTLVRNESICSLMW